MDLTLTGDLARHVLAMTKNDKRLARIMARELLASIDRKVMAAYLLTDDLALDLLALRLATDLETTFAELQQLAAGEPSPRKRRARPVAAKKKPTRARAKPKTRTRARAKPKKRSAGRRRSGR